MLAAKLSRKHLEICTVAFYWVVLLFWCSFCWNIQTLIYCSAMHFQSCSLNPTHFCRTAFHLTSLFSSGWMSSINSLARKMITLPLQKARPSARSHLQPRADPQTGCLDSWNSHWHQEQEQPPWPWRGRGPPRLCRLSDGHRELVAMPTHEGVTTTTIPNWCGWVASWEPVKCRTSAIGSISLLARVAEKTLLPLIPGAPTVLDDFDKTFK